MQADTEKATGQQGRQAAGKGLPGTWTSGQMAAYLQDKELETWKQIQWLKGTAREQTAGTALVWKHAMLAELMREFGIPLLPMQWGSGPALDTEWTGLGLPGCRDVHINGKEEG